jgi:hypothetical protein
MGGCRFVPFKLIEEFVWHTQGLLHLKSPDTYTST